MSWWIIGFLILLVLGTLVTLYYLKPIKEGFDFTSSTTVPQIYLVTKSSTNQTGSGMTYIEANTACSLLAGRLAFPTDVYLGAKDGANWDTPGWIGGDKTYGYCPVSDGNEMFRAKGPAVARHNAEMDVDCNGNYSATTPNAAICYGILPKQSYTTDYKIYTNLYFDEFVGYTPISKNSILDTATVSSIYDKNNNDLSGSYTIIDLDALNTQKTIITLDIKSIHNTVYTKELENVNMAPWVNAGDFTDEQRLTAEKTTRARYGNISNIADSDDKKRFYAGYVLASKHLDVLTAISKQYDNIIYATDPYYYLVSAFTSVANSPGATPILFYTYRYILLNNINYYFSDIMSKLNSLPLGYISSGILNTPQYLNAFGLMPLHPISWEYTSHYSAPMVNSLQTRASIFSFGSIENANFYSDFSIYKRRPAPHSGTQIVTYKNSISQQGNGIDDNWMSILYHCPGGKWWQDKQTRTWLWESCPPDTPYGGYGKLSSRGSTDCYLEYPLLENKITVRDLNFVKMPNFPSMSYPTTFLHKNSTWTPTATTPDGSVVLNAFLAEKNRIALEYGKGSDNDRYRYKPIKYLGKLSPKNIEEAKKAAIIASYFYFLDGLTIEKQLRIASTPPFNLCFSKYANAKPEYVETFVPGTVTPENTDLLRGLTIGAAVVATVGGLAGATGQVRGAAAASRSFTSVASSRITTGLNVVAGVGGAASAAMAGASLGIRNSSMTATNTKLAATNADYNASVCTPFTAELLNLLPYHTREYISVWAVLRKSRVLTWYASSVLKQASDNKNPEGGPYEGSPKAKKISDDKIAQNSISVVKAPTDSSTATSGTTVDINENGTNVAYIINDTSGNLFEEAAEYNLNENKTINSITPESVRNTVYDSMAQAYYELNGRKAKIQTIIDVYQVGTTMYDVRFTETRRSGSSTFTEKIAELNAKYAQYRNMSLSNNEYLNLEATYSSVIDELYRQENSNIVDAAQDCGYPIKAQQVIITQSGTGASLKPFNISQIIALNNYGQNVAYLRIPTVSSVLKPNVQITELAPYEDAVNTVYIDANSQPYPAATASAMAVRDNSGTILSKLTTLTDGTYTKRYDSFFKTKSTVTDASIMIDFGDSYDITSVILKHSNEMNGGKFIVKLLASNNTEIGTRELIWGNTGSSKVSFLRQNSDTPALPCPTDVYSMYKVGRFFASSATVATTGPPLIFEAYADGTDAATTFNPLYNAGIVINSTSPYGNVDYKPTIVYDNSAVASAALPSCSDPERIKKVFKDHLLYVNSSEFQERGDITRATDGAPLLNIPYNYNYTYKPAAVISAANVSSNNYTCAYKWLENVYDASGQLLGKDTILIDTASGVGGTKLGTTSGTTATGQIERYGIFQYTYDTENWVSRGVVFNMLSSMQYNSADTLKARITGGVQKELVPLASPQSLYIPYWDSLTLDNKGGQCPETDCSDPEVINSIITAYNSNSNVTNDKKVLRITKALTTAKDRCEYEYVTRENLHAISSFQIITRVNSIGNCSYVPSRVSETDISPKMGHANFITNTTPLLARAYNYGAESVKTFTNMMSGLYDEVYTRYLAPQVDENGIGIKGDLIKYRTTTNVAAGHLRNVSVIGSPVMNELKEPCFTQCNSPEIIKSFFAYYNNRGGDKVTQIQNTGMDASGNCDFTYETKPVNYTGGVVTFEDDRASTRASKFKIERYINSCAYHVTGDPAVIQPTPDLVSVMNFSSVNVFTNPTNTEPTYPVGPPENTKQVSPINTAGMNSIGTTPIKGGVNAAGVEQNIISSGAPFTQATSVANVRENIDYIKCQTRYTVKALLDSGLTDTITGIAQVDTKTCDVQTAIGKKRYVFAAKPGIVGVAANLVVSSHTVTSATIPALTTPISPNISLTCSQALVCGGPTTNPLTGFSGMITASEKLDDNTCEYIITADKSLPFENTFKVASFYTGESLNGSGNDFRIKSISNSDPATSKFAYFKTTDIRPTFLTDYMPLLQHIRYTRNKEFYIKNPDNTADWKMGIISAVGILANEDAIVFEAAASKFGQYGAYDIREYTAKRYFKFSMRITTANGKLDPALSLDTQIKNKNIKIYRSEDFDGPAPAYRGPTSKFTIDDPTYNLICTHYSNPTNITDNQRMNYNRSYFDSYPNPTLLSDLLTPSNAPSEPFVVQTPEAVLGRGKYNRVRFTVTKSAMTGPDPLNGSPARAEITRIMFYNYGYDPKYNAAGLNIGIDSTTGGYKYQQIPNATVMIEDSNSNYLLVESDSPTCKPGYKKIIDPETKLALCYYLGEGGSNSYTQTTPCNQGDTTASVTTGESGSQTYECIRPTTYSKPSGIACGIGYFGLTTGDTCSLIGNFERVTENPQNMFNANQAVPRLRLPVNKSMTILFNRRLDLDGYSEDGRAGFSFITGSMGTLPLQWRLEGSMNGLSWKVLHCQSVDYSYAGAHVAANGQIIKSFFSPGIFLINKPGTSGAVCTTPASVVDLSGGYSSTNLKGYLSISIPTTAEGFQTGRAPTLDSIFSVPLKQGDVPSLRPVNSVIPEPKRIQILKFKILKTYDPNSKFVHMSQLQFLTRSGIIPAAAVKLSNLHGSRSSPKEGVAALLEGPQKRWVDYNKSDILIQFTNQREPIIGFRFSIPQGVPQAKAMEAMPIEWIVTGSYDRQNWITLHEFNKTTLPLVNSYATVVFKMEREV